MTFEQYSKGLSNVAKDLKSGPGAEIMVQVAITAFTLLRQRVQEKGVDAHGQKYHPYSTKPTLIGYTTFLRKDVAERLFSSKEKRGKMEWRTVKGNHLAILEGGYKKIRELQGRQTNHVDFSFTNNMWNDIMAVKPKKSDLLSTDADHRKGIAIIGAKQDIEKKKLAGNTKRKGDILDVSASEIEILKKQYNLGVLQIFKENGL
jgi:hypothetical protein